MDIHKNLNQTTELDSARNDLSVEKKLLDCIEMTSQQRSTLG